MRPSSARLLGCARLCFCLFCFCLFGASSGRAAAVEHLSVSLRYAAGPTCPDAAGFTSVVAARLGYDPFRDEAADHVLVRITPHGGELDGRIEWRDVQGKWAGDQSFPSASPDCPRLARAMGLALAVQIQLLAGTRAAAPAAEAAPAVPAPTEPGAPAAVPPPPRPAAVPPVNEPAVVPTATERIVPAATPATGPSFSLGIGPSVGFGLSSEPVVLGRLFGAVVWPRFSVELGAQASLLSTPRRKDGAGFSQRLTLATLSGCAGGTRWSGCLLMVGGVVSMAGRDIDIARSARVPIFSAGARLGLTQSLGRRAFLFAHADGLTNVVRWRGELDDLGVWTAPPFAAAVGIDAGIRFP